MSEDGEYEASEDNTNYKAISCEQIPELFLDKLVAKKHFSKFGKIKSFSLRPKRLSCTVEYEAEEDAERAYMEAGNFNGIDFVVNYAEIKVPQVQNTEEWVDPEVQAELEAMSPGRGSFVGSNSMRSVFSASSLPKSALSRISSKPSNTLPPPKPIKMTATRVDSPQPDVPKIDASVRSELEAMLRRPAFTDEDKYRVLDARDKLIRLTTVRQTDIKKAVSTKGTCPDMCPEKERLMREYQRQVSIFEMANNSEGSLSNISHRKAIKEYSRSSADQEVPLSHELRSESVLQLTMLYLMHRIMDLCDDPQTSLGDWFHFVWDRTRSIRKDITQQELCSLGAVQLVEQCSRFHIHCAARLVAEDPSVFDKKINAENLTKCLQTLKYMYHDLRIKGIFCPSETEFRSYIILLNLGDSNFLWELKQLPISIQKSAEIKRAIAFYNALQNNNYVRFFAMIRSRETSYLEACILLGYFSKLRLHAMEAIVKSHNWRKNDVYLPLSYLSRVLGFDDETSALNFFVCHGLQCDEMEDRVLLERLSKPDMEYAMDRALKLVESKRQVSVGECVCGQTLPSAAILEQHQPHSSFDANGLLCLESWTTDDQLRGEEACKRSLEKQQKPQVPVQPVLSAPATAFKAPETNIFKMPQASPPISPKQQQRQQQQPKSIFGSFAKDETKSVSPGGFKFAGNIFGGSVSSKSSISSVFESVQESSETPVFKLTSNSQKQESTNLFQNSIFKPNPERSLAGNIFGGFNAVENKSTASGSLFNAANEQVNIFQQQPSTDSLKSDNVFQHFKPEKPIFGGIPPPSSSLTITPQPFNIQQSQQEEIEQRKLELHREQAIKQQQLDEERRKLKELQEKRLREKQQREEQRLKELERKRLEQLRELCLRKAEEETVSIVNSIIQQEVEKLANEELHKYAMVQEASKLQTELLISEVVEAIVEDVGREEYAIMCYDQLILNRYFNRWLQHLRKKREQRKLMESTPLWITTDSRAQFAAALEHPCQDTNMEMIKRYRLGQPCDFEQLIKITKHPGIGSHSPLCLFSLVGRHLSAKKNFTPAGLLQQRQYFKFLISVPSDKEELPGFETFCNKWLFKHIRKAQLETGPFVHGLLHDLALCVRKISGIYPKNEQGDEMKREGDHSDGLVFFISGEDFSSQAKRRLYNLLYIAKNFKKIPVAIIAYNCLMDCEQVAVLLDLDSLEEQGLLCKYKIFGNNTSRKDFSFRKCVRDAIDFIAAESYTENYSDIQALAMENVLSFLDSSLGEEIWHRWLDSAKKNPVFQKVCQEPEYVEGIYHKALQHLIHITQEDFSEMPEFPEELKEFVPQQNSLNIPLGLQFFPSDWKEANGKKVMYNFLQKLYLPALKEYPPCNVEDLELWILNYASNCLPHDDMIATKAAHESIGNLVQQLKQLQLQELETTDGLKCLNYLTILKPIVFAYINSALQQFSGELMDTPVIYLKSDLKIYQTQPWWLNYQPLDLVNMVYSQPIVENANSEVSDSLDSELSAENLNDIVAKAEATALKAEENLLAIKQKKHQKSPAVNAKSLNLKRTLDESLYKFELSKKIGHYDTTYIDELTHDIDASIREVILPPSPRKRQRINLKSPGKNEGKSIEINDVLARAKQLIEKVEAVEDRKEKIRTTNKLFFGT